MALADLNSIQFYQPLTTAGLRSDGRPTVSNLHVPTAYGKGKKASESLQDFGVIEFLDMTGPPPKEPIDPLHIPAPNLCTEKDASGPSNIAHTEGGYESDNTLPSFEELLFGAGEVSESQRAGSSVEHGVGRSGGAFKHPTLEGYDYASTSGPRQGGDQGGDINDSSSVHPRSDGSTSNEQVGKQCPLSTPPTSLAGSEAGCFILYEKTEDSISNPPPLPDSRLSLTRDTKTCFKNTRPYHSGGGKEKGDKGASCSTDNIIPYSLRSPIAMCSPTQFTNAEPDISTGATDIRDSSKRTADTAGLNDGGESVLRLEKARRADPIVIDETDDTDDDLSDVEFARIRSQPKPVFRLPPSPRTFQQYEKTTSSSRFSEVGNSQDDPLVVEDNEEKNSETGGSTRVTSMNSEIGTAHLQSSHPRQQPETHGCLSSTTTEPTPSSLDRHISSSVALSCDRVEQSISGGDGGAAATVHPPHAITITRPLPEQHQDQGGSALDEEEWEIERIVGKRRRGKGYEYKVCWEETWLLESELGNAQGLLQQFKAKNRAQRGGKRGRPAHPDKGR